MNSILKLKHWQVFIILIAGLILSNINIEGSPMLTTILILIGITTYFSWILLVGHGLYQVLPPRIEMNYNLF